jgi:hypothetical protein
VAPNVDGPLLQHIWHKVRNPWMGAVACLLNRTMLRVTVMATALQVMAAVNFVTSATAVRLTDGQRFAPTGRDRQPRTLTKMDEY